MFHNLEKLTKVAAWIKQVQPNGEISDLYRLIEVHFGPISVESQMGYGEGSITASVGDIEGGSYGDCTMEEALVELAFNLLTVTTPLTTPVARC